MAAYPSMMGICISIKMRSKDSVVAFETACKPFSAASTRAPARPKTNWINLRFVSPSSTTSMRWLSNRNRGRRGNRAWHINGAGEVLQQFDSLERPNAEFASESRTVAQLALHRDAAPEQLGESATDGQAQARAAKLAGDRRIGLRKRIEDQPQLFRRNADARVGDLDDKFRNCAVGLMERVR